MVVEALVFVCMKWWLLVQMMLRPLSSVLQDSEEAVAESGCCQGDGGAGSVSAPLPQSRDCLHLPAGRPAALHHLDGLVNTHEAKEFSVNMRLLRVSGRLQAARMRIKCKNANLCHGCNKDCIFLKFLSLLCCFLGKKSSNAVIKQSGDKSVRLLNLLNWIYLKAHIVILSRFLCIWMMVALNVSCPCFFFLFSVMIIIIKEKNKRMKRTAKGLNSKMTCTDNCTVNWKLVCEAVYIQ